MPINEFVELCLHTQTVGKLCKGDAILTGIVFGFAAQIDNELDGLDSESRSEYIYAANRAITAMRRAHR